MTLGEKESSSQYGSSLTAIKTEPTRAVCDVTPPVRMLDAAWKNTETVETPVQLILYRRAIYHSAESYKFMCEAKGYNKTTVTLKPGLSRDLWWNVLWYKAMPLTVAIDMATGDAWQYPKSVTIKPEPAEAVTD
jgi:hypothetical protein